MSQNPECSCSHALWLSCLLLEGHLAPAVHHTFTLSSFSMLLPFVCPLGDFMNFSFPMHLQIALAHIPVPSPSPLLKAWDHVGHFCSTPCDTSKMPMIRSHHPVPDANTVCLAQTHSTLLHFPLLTSTVRIAGCVLPLSPHSGL